MSDKGIFPDGAPDKGETPALMANYRTQVPSDQVGQLINDRQHVSKVFFAAQVHVPPQKQSCNSFYLNSIERRVDVRQGHSKRGWFNDRSH